MICATNKIHFKAIADIFNFENSNEGDFPLSHHEMWEIIIFRYYMFIKEILHSNEGDQYV